MNACVIPFYLMMPNTMPKCKEGFSPPVEVSITIRLRCQYLITHGVIGMKHTPYTCIPSIPYLKEVTIM